MAGFNSVGQSRSVNGPGTARWPAGLTAAAAVIGPVFGVIVGDELGSSTGPVFLVCALAAAVFVGFSVTPAGLWWTLCAMPAVIAVASIGAELLFHPKRPPYVGTKQQVVGIAHGTVHAFPVMAIVEVVLVGIAVVRYMRSRPEADSGMQQGRSAHV